MSRTDLFNQLRALIGKVAENKVDWDVVTEDTLIESLGFDSLSVLDMLYDIQQEFGLEFDTEALVSVRTVGNLIDLLDNEPVEKPR